MPSSKVIALFIDGTWDRPTGRIDSNVRKLFLACRHDRHDPVAPQVCYYLPGVGTDIGLSHPGSASGLHQADPALQKFGSGEIHPLLWRLRKLIGGGTGRGTTERIREAYAFLCSEYDRRRGDRVFIFGFSRGAYAARSLVNFISRVGILLADRLAHVEEAYRLYESGGSAKGSAFDRHLRQLVGKVVEGPEDEDALIVHFVGVWDTVGAMGIPGRQARYEARHTEFSARDLPPNVMAARQALALHELRQPFEPMLWDNGHLHPDLMQVWFAGAHGDVGGGYPLSESGLSDIALRWMATEAEAYGLAVSVPFGLSPPFVHCELRRWFRFFRPETRKALTDLLNAGQDHVQALHFHASVSTHLLAASERSYRHRRAIRQKLFEVDEQALRLFVAARLNGAHRVDDRR